MAGGTTASRGGLSDRVRLFLGGEEINIAESYTVTVSILSQPAHWSMRLGHGDVVADLLKKYPPGTKFQLQIGDTVQQSGYIDGPDVDDSSGASMVTFFGRDALAPLQSGHVDVERSFSNDTYEQLVAFALEAVGLDSTKLVVDGGADASARSLVKQTNQVPTKTSHGKYVSGGGTVSVSTVQCKLGESWMTFVRRYIDRIGLVLWAGADGTFILGEPLTGAAPSYRIVRQRGQPRNSVSATRAHFRNDTSNRHTEVTIYSRYGQLKFPRAKVEGTAVDDEMFNLSPLFANRGLTIRDPHVANTEQGEFLARRKQAEERRQGRTLTYSVPGHTVTSLATGQRSIWNPNTIVDVQDDEYGIYGPHWIESCDYERMGRTQTQLHLMRPTDIILGADEDG